MQRRLAAIASLASLLLVPQIVVAQQATMAADSTKFPTGPTTEVARVGVTPVHKKKHDKLPFVFYGGLGVAAASVAVFHVDPDTGGYRDGWTTDTDFPDKAVHALAAWALTSVGVDLGVRPKYSAAAVCVAGTAFEFAQGYVSAYDIAADCAGAAAAAAWRTWRARRRANSAGTR